MWESKEQLDAFNETVFPKAMARAGVSMEGPPETVEFDPIGVMTPGHVVRSSRVPAALSA